MKLASCDARFQFYLNHSQVMFAPSPDEYDFISHSNLSATTSTLSERTKLYLKIVFTQPWTIPCFAKLKTGTSCKSTVTPCYIIL